MTIIRYVTAQNSSKKGFEYCLQFDVITTSPMLTWCHPFSCPTILPQWVIFPEPGPPACTWSSWAFPICQIWQTGEKMTLCLWHSARRKDMITLPRTNMTGTFFVGRFTAAFGWSACRKPSWAQNYIFRIIRSDNDTQSKFSHNCKFPKTYFDYSCVYMFVWCIKCI